MNVTLKALADEDAYVDEPGFRISQVIDCVNTLDYENVTAQTVKELISDFDWLLEFAHTQPSEFKSETYEFILDTLNKIPRNKKSLFTEQENYTSFIVNLVGFGKPHRDENQELCEADLKLYEYLFDSMSNFPCAVTYEDDYPSLVDEPFDKIYIRLIRENPAALNWLLTGALYYRYGFNSGNNGEALDGLPENERILDIWRNCSGAQEKVRLNREDDFFDPKNQRDPTFEEQYAREAAWIRKNMAKLEEWLYWRKNSSELTNLYRRNGISNFARYTNLVLQQQCDLPQKPINEAGYILRIMPQDDHNGAFNSYKPVVFSQQFEGEKPSELIIEAASIGELLYRILKCRRTLEPFPYIVVSGHGNPYAVIIGDSFRFAYQTTDVHALQSPLINEAVFRSPYFANVKNELAAPRTQIVLDACSTDERDGMKDGMYTIAQTVGVSTSVPVHANTTTGWSDQGVEIDENGQIHLNLSVRHKDVNSVRTILPTDFA